MQYRRAAPSKLSTHRNRHRSVGTGPTELRNTHIRHCSCRGCCFCFFLPPALLTALLRLLPLDLALLRVAILGGGAAASRDPFKLSKTDLATPKFPTVSAFQSFQTMQKLDS